MRFTDPSGHACVEGTSYCVNSNTGQTLGSLTNYNDSSTLSSRLDGKVKEEKEEDNTQTQPIISLPAEPNTDYSIDEILNFEQSFYPFGKDENIVYCESNGCIVILPLDGKIKFDWSRVDKKALAMDLFALSLSFFGLEPIAKASRITPFGRGLIQGSNVSTTIAINTYAVQKGDYVPLYLTGIGILFPPSQIANAGISVLDDIGDGFYSEPYDQTYGPTYGPPAP